MLAAGASRRLGAPKQLLPYRGSTMLEHTLHAAQGSVVAPILVVVGAHAEIILSQTDCRGASIIFNNNWEEGMASSIRCGIEHLVRLAPDTCGAVILLCDQPYISATQINVLVEAHIAQGKPIIASTYKDTHGAPCLFHRSFFPELLALHGDTGAKAIIKANPAATAFVAFAKGVTDIDTAADYDELLKNQ